SASDLSRPHQERGGSSTESRDQVASYPFIGSVTSLVPGHELVARYQFDMSEHLFLRDHTLGGRISAGDDDLMALPAVPLAVSMEMLAQAAAVLVPNCLLVGMKDIRAYRWIALDQNGLTLEVTAKRNASASRQEVEVEIAEVADRATPEDHQRNPLIGGTMIFDDR